MVMAGAMIMFVIVGMIVYVGMVMIMDMGVIVIMGITVIVGMVLIVGMVVAVLLPRFPDRNFTLSASACIAHIVSIINVLCKDRNSVAIPIQPAMI